MVAEKLLRSFSWTVSGRSGVSCWLVQDLLRATESRQWAPAPDISLGRSKYNNLTDNELPSGVESEGAGLTANILKGPVQLSDSALRTLASVPDLAPWPMVTAVLKIHWYGRP